MLLEGELMKIILVKTGTFSSCVWKNDYRQLNRDLKGRMKMVTKSVVVLPYDEHWEHAFIQIKDEIQEALGSLALSIEHVGSTSVRGLSAKPIPLFSMTPAMATLAM